MKNEKNSKKEDVKPLFRLRLVGKYSSYFTTHLCLLISIHSFQTIFNPIKIFSLELTETAGGLIVCYFATLRI